jgi:TRAP-type C4-dicarboxylate transport system permease small subunit
MKNSKFILSNLEEFLSCALFLVMCISVALGVLARFFDLALVWTDELARYSFIWSVLLGTVVVFKQKKHIAVDFMESVFPEKMTKVIHVLIHVALLILFLILLRYGWMLTQQTWNVPTTSLEIPTGLVYLAVPVSSFLLCLYTVIELYKMTFKKLSKPA